MNLPPNHVGLLKLIWCPDDYDEVRKIVKPSLFRTKELDGKGENHVSIDRADMSVRANMEAIATKQQAKADGIVHKRESALIGRISTAAVRAQAENNQRLFEVKSVPVPGNDAHCGIFNISGRKGRGDVDELKGKLAKLIASIETFDQVYG